MKRRHLLALALTFSCWSPSVGSAADAPPPAPQGEAADEVSSDDASDEDVPWCKDEAIVKGAERLIRESGGTPLHFAALNNDTAAIRKLVSEGADIDAQTSAAGGVGSLPGGRLTPLHVAAAMQREDAALLLLELGADPTIVSGYRDTALHLAVSNGEVRLTEALVRARGVDINALQGIGMTPLALASMAPNSTKLMRLLLDAGADPKARDKEGRTPLHLAGDADVCRLLLAAGADPDARDEHGNTPLHVVNNAKACRLLPEAGADPNSPDDEGHTPLQLIRRDEVRQVLLDAGAHPTDPLPDGGCDLEED